MHTRIAADLWPKDVLLGDRAQCVLGFLQAIANRQAYFVIRQHGRYQGVLIGERRHVGETARGQIYE